MRSYAHARLTCRPRARPGRCCPIYECMFDISGQKRYIGAMAHIDVNMVIPEQFPELARLAWNRDATRPIPGEEAFALYERNWRHVDREHLVPHEAALIEQLKLAYGGGHLLV